MDPYLGCIITFGGNFAMKGFQLCAGQIMSLSQNTALFSLLGTYYGGDGRSTFGLPDLRGRTPIQQGQGPGLSDYAIGELTGATQVTLLSSNIPSHNHQLQALNSPVSPVNSPANNVFGEGPKTSGFGGTSPHYYKGSNTAPNTALNIQTIGVNIGGGSTPVNIRSPYLAISFLIAMSGVFPARN